MSRLDHERSSRGEGTTPAIASEGAAHVFVCYAHEDEASVFPIVEWLEAQGVALWHDRGIEAGSLWRHEIASALSLASHVLFFVSSASLASDHCDREVQYGIDHRKKLVPVFLESVELTPALHIGLDRVQALHAWRLSPGELKSRILAAIVRAGTAAEPVRVARDVARTPAMRRWQMPVLAIAIAISMLAAWYVRRPVAETLPTRSIAVLPFHVVGGAAPLRNVAEGVVDDVTNELASHRRFAVASRSDAARVELMGTKAEVARQLGVSYLVEGSIRDDSGTTKVTAQLTRGRDGVHLWSGAFDLDEPDGARHATRMIAYHAHAFADVDVRLAMDRLETNNAEAFEAYASAVRVVWEGGTGGTAGSPEYVLAAFDRAIALDPEFAPAHHWRSQIRSCCFSGRNREERLAIEADAWQSLQRSLELRPDSAIGQQALGWFLALHRRDLAAADLAFARARELDPDEPETYASLASLAMMRGDADSAQRFFRQCHDLDPTAFRSHTQLAIVLASEGAYDEADRELDTAIELVPRSADRLSPVLWKISVAYLRGDLVAAQSRFESAWNEFGAAYPDAFSTHLPRFGHEAKLRAMMAEWDAREYVPPRLRFNAHHGLGEQDAAIHWLKEALSANDLDLRQIVRLDILRSLRANPRYAEVLAHLDSLEVSH